MLNEWNGFNDGVWTKEINVRNFIQKNYTLYEGDDSFLADVSQKTKKVWNKCEELLAEELKKGGVLDVETDIISGITNFAPGYIDKENEVIVGLQIDAPLKRIVNLYSGKRMAHQSLEQYGYKLNEESDRHFNEYRKTHNEGVFDAYPKRTRLARTAGLLTELPDAYGRGRIIGDYRRVALYGIDHLIEEKQKDLNFENGPMTEDRIRLREEISEQIRALSKMKEMAATSLGRTSTFLDIYIERDLKNGVITETEAQELIDQFIIKLRLTRHLRTPEYDELFGGDPTWITESIGGVGINGKPLVTKNSFRYLHTLYNIGTAPEPNLTVLWSEKLPDNFKHFCAKVSIDTDSIQYENDDVLDFDKVWENYKRVMTYVAELYVDTVNIIHFMHDKYAYEASQFALHDTNLERIAAYGIAGLSIAADSLSAIKYATVKPIRNENGALASLNSVAKIPYRDVCQDGVSNTFSIVPDALGKDQEQRVQNLTTILDGYFVQGAHHLNVNVMHRETLIDAMEHPEKYPTLTIRVSGYAVNFNRLSREQQEEVIRRTFHQSM